MNQTVVNFKGMPYIQGAMSVVGRRRLICCRGEFPDGLFDGFDPIRVENRDFAAGNVICLAEDEVLADGSGDHDNVFLLENSGVRVTRIDLSEFRKGAGGPSCLILPVARKTDMKH